MQPHEGDLPESDSESSDDEMIRVSVDEKPREQWDCESILSE